MRSDCEGSTTLEEKGAEVFDYSYGDIVKSRIQWFEQLNGRTFAPKSVTDVWSCWAVPDHIPGAYGQKIQLESLPTSDDKSGREEITPSSKAPIQDGFGTGGKSVQFEVNVGQHFEVQQERRPTDPGSASRPADQESISRPPLKSESCLEVQDSIAGPDLKSWPGFDVQQEGRPADPVSISGPSLKSGHGLLRSPLLVSQTNKVSGPDMTVNEMTEFIKGQS